MPAITCPFCKSLTNFSQNSTIGFIPPRLRLRYQGLDSIDVLTCNNEHCAMPLIAAFNGGRIVTHWPRTEGGKDFPDVPPPVAAAADEAHRCLSADAPRGAIALARAAVEALAKERGVTSGNLMAKIDSLAEKGVISEAMKDAAHEVRFAGNEIAHGDLVDEPLGADDAEEVLALMDAILLRVYQEPAQVGRV